MRKKILALVTAGIALLGIQIVSADICAVQGWYVGASGAIAWHNNTRLSNFATIRHKAGYGGNVSIGFLFDSVWRLELEGVFRFFDNESVHNAVTSHTKINHGHIREIAGLVNLVYDIPICNCLDLYVGAGIGAGQLHLKQIDRSSPPFSETDSLKFAYDFLAGFALDINYCWALTVGWRYFAIVKPNFSKRTADGNHIRFTKTPYSNGAELGLRYKF